MYNYKYTHRKLKKKIRKDIFYIYLFYDVFKYNFIIFLYAFINVSLCH